MNLNEDVISFGTKQKQFHSLPSIALRPRNSGGRFTTTDGPNGVFMLGLALSRL